MSDGTLSRIEYTLVENHENKYNDKRIYILLLFITTLTTYKDRKEYRHRQKVNHFPSSHTSRVHPLKKKDTYVAVRL